MAKLQRYRVIPLLDFPAEIRIIIYNFALLTETEFRIPA